MCTILRLALAQLMTAVLLAGCAGGSSGISPSRASTLDVHEYAIESVTARFDGVEKPPALTKKLYAEGPIRWPLTLGQDLPKGVFAETAQGVRHRQSALICTADLKIPSTDRDQGLELALALQNAVILQRRGDDVACHYGATEDLPAVTVFVSDASGTSTAGGLEDAMAAMRRQFPEARSVPLAVEPDLDGRDVKAGSLLIGSLDGRPVKSTVWVVDVEDWQLRLRMTYFAETAHLRELGAALILSTKAEDLLSGG